MSDAPSLPTRSELAELLPGRFVGLAELTPKLRRSRVYDPSVVRVKQRYVAIPKQAWISIGSPMRVDLCWDGWDAFLFGCTDGYHVNLESPGFVRIRVNGCGHSPWSMMLERGHFRSETKRLYGMPCLRIVGCNRYHTKTLRA